LCEKGWTVYLTRTNDLDVAVTNRVLLADQWQPGLFISLHFNSGLPANVERSGVQTYCLTPAGMPSSFTRGYEDNLQQSFPNNSYDQQNFHLATRLHRSLVRATGSKDQGVQRARFLSVLRGQNRPAALIEGGFLSNHQEARLISTVAYREKLAGAVAKVLEEL
jgi:N-acetylmuramoyl-L-alanine amidase